MNSLSSWPSIPGMVDLLPTTGVASACGVSGQALDYGRMDFGDFAACSPADTTAVIARSITSLDPLLQFFLVTVVKLDELGALHTLSGYQRAEEIVTERGAKADVVKKDAVAEKPLKSILQGSTAAKVAAAGAGVVKKRVSFSPEVGLVVFLEGSRAVHGSLPLRIVPLNENDRCTGGVVPYFKRAPDDPHAIQHAFNQKGEIDSLGLKEFTRCGDILEAFPSFVSYQLDSKLLLSSVTFADLFQGYYPPDVASEAIIPCSIDCSLQQVFFALVNELKFGVWRNPAKRGLFSLSEVEKVAHALTSTVDYYQNHYKTFNSLQKRHTNLRGVWSCCMALLVMANKQRLELDRELFYCLVKILGRERWKQKKEGAACLSEEVADGGWADFNLYPELDPKEIKLSADCASVVDSKHPTIPDDIQASPEYLLLFKEYLDGRWKAGETRVLTVVDFSDEKLKVIAEELCTLLARPDIRRFFYGWLGVS